MKAFDTQFNRWIWSDVDLAQMDWNASPVHGLATVVEKSQLLLDLDYRLGSVRVTEPNSAPRCWVAPATLVFEGVWNVEFHLNSSVGQFEIATVRRFTLNSGSRHQEWLWVLDAFEWQDHLATGGIRLESTGYTQYIRKRPILIEGWTLDTDQRGGISFDCTTPPDQGDT